MPEQLGYQFDRVYAQPIERYRQLATIAERDAIPTGKRWEGMLCYVTSEGKDYQLSGGLTNSDWVVTVNNPSDYMVKIGDYWVDKGANTDTANLEVGDYFQGWIESDTRYVIGKVLALPFDVDDETKAKIIVDSNSIKIKRIVDATVTTTYDLDHALASDWKLTMTGNTTFTESNLPTGDNTIEFTIKLTGAFTPTFPTYWDVLGDAYDGSVWNFIAVQIHDGESGTEEATAFITNM